MQSDLLMQVPKLRETSTHLPYPSLAEFPVIDTLRLIRSENVGTITFFQLVKQFGSPAKALSAIADLSLKGGRKQPIRVCSKEEAEKELDAIKKFGAHTIVYGSVHYPKLLHQIYDPPPFLTAHGNSALWNGKTCLAIVGARNASANGYHFGQKIAREAAERCIIIVSGLARGIDTGAHKGSIASGTVGVIAGGIDTIYPPENEALFFEMRDKACIITENPFGMAPHARSFPARNRIISGMSVGTLIVEASLKSGSLITARMANEQNREVFAVPGSPLDPRCKGTNDLLKHGAILCESIDDILPHLSRSKDLLFESSNDDYAPPPIGAIDDTKMREAREHVIEKLGPTAVHVDEIIRQTDLPAQLVWIALLELELAGRLLRTPGGKVALRLV
jgi:DNA processing protein